MSEPIYYECCDPSITITYESTCELVDCLYDDFFKLNINGIDSPYCWKATKGFEGIPVIATIVVTDGPYDSCTECLHYDYKLYNCTTNAVVYTDYINCPDCYLHINNLTRTNLSPIACWYISVTNEPMGLIVPVSIISLDVPCPVCIPKCYTITGTGNVTYYNLDLEFVTEPLPAVICAGAYPSVSGSNNTITVGSTCSLVTPCPIYCYTLTNCLTQETLITNNEELAYPYVLNEIVVIAEHPGCWSITRVIGNCPSPVQTTIIQTYTDCIECLPPYFYRLESCGNSDPIILYVYQDLSAYVGQTITLDNYEGCYNVTIYEGDVPNPVTVIVNHSYPDCLLCVTPRYKLTDCDGIRPSIYTTTNLSAYLASVIKLTFYPDTCWSVEETEINSSDDLVIVDSEYASCEICTTNTVCFCSTLTNNSTTTQTFQFEDCDNNIQTIHVSANTLSRQYCVLRWIYPDDWTLPKIFSNNGPCIDGGCPSDLPFRSIRPGYNSPACTEQYYERIACAYSEILYKDVIAQRYGIAPCCDEEELYRLDIKYQLLELQAINNPDYICRPFSDCCNNNTDCGCGCNNNSSCQQTTNCGCGCNS